MISTFQVVLLLSPRQINRILHALVGRVERTQTLDQADTDPYLSFTTQPNSLVSLSSFLSSLWKNINLTSLSEKQHLSYNIIRENTHKALVQCQHIINGSYYHYVGSLQKDLLEALTICFQLYTHMPHTQTHTHTPHIHTPHIHIHTQSMYPHPLPKYCLHNSLCRDIFTLVLSQGFCPRGRVKTFLNC